MHDENKIKGAFDFQEFYIREKIMLSYVSVLVSEILTSDHVGICDME